MEEQLRKLQRQVNLISQNTKAKVRYLGGKSVEISKLPLLVLMMELQ